VLPGPDDEFTAYSRVSLVADPSVRVSMEIAVHPASQCLGIGSALYHLAEERAQRLQAPYITTPVYLKEGEPRPEATNFLSNRGFFPDRSYWQMRLNHIADQPAPCWPQGITFRRFDRGLPDAELWASLINATFDEEANPVRILAQLSETGHNPDGYIFAIDQATGREIGTSRARIDLVGGEQIGYVGTVGVLPGYRRRGIAQALILQTLSYLAAQGMKSAVLFVEGKNYNARQLYEKMGWRAVYQTVHYWKRMT
jgi:mycothiol synthase